MTKPKAKAKNRQKRAETVISSKVQKKQKKPHGGQSQLKKQILQETNGVGLKKCKSKKLLQRNGGLPKELSKPGAFVLAPPKTPEEARDSTDDSNSEDEDYMNQFFDDVDLAGGDNGSVEMSQSSEESEPSEEDSEAETSNDEEEEDMEDEDNNYLEALPEEEEVEEDGNEDTQEEEDEDAEEDQDRYQPKLLTYFSDDSSEESSSTYDFSPLDPDLIMGDDNSDFEFNYEDGEEIDIESYSESFSDPSTDDDSYSSSEGDPDEFVEGNCRFLAVDESKIKFPTNGAAMVELENDDYDSCPELVPIPDSFRKAPPPPHPSPKTNTKKTVPSPKEVPVDPQRADLTFCLSTDFSEVLLHLKQPVYFHGMLSIRVIAGCIAILHHQRSSDDSSEILAMATVDDYPVRLSAVPQPGISFSRCIGDASVLKGFHHSHLMQIKHSFADTDAVLLLRPIDLRHIKFTQSHMSKKLLPDEFWTSLESILKCQFYHSHPKQFSPIEHLIDRTPSAHFPRIITVGGKNTGKSTFNKCLVNNLLSGDYEQVLYIDLDIGQPEFGAPQTISAYLLDSPIIGKGFLKCHKMAPYFALVYGHLNVAADPIRYANCVAELFRHLNSQSEVTPIPWVVNTMGYVRGIGLDLMHFILSQLKPTRVLQFRHPQHHLENFPTRIDSTFMRNHESILFPSTTECALDFEWKSVNGFIGNRAEDVRQLKGSEARTMNLLSHLGLALNKDFATVLNEVDPIW